MSFWAGWFCGGLSAVGVLWMLKKAKPSPEERIDLAARAVALDEQQRAARKAERAQLAAYRNFAAERGVYYVSPQRFYPTVPPEWAHDIEPGDGD